MWWVGIASRFKPDQKNENTKANRKELIFLMSNIRMYNLQIGERNSLKDLSVYAKIGITRSRMKEYQKKSMRQQTYLLKL